MTDDAPPDAPNTQSTLSATPTDLAGMMLSGPEAEAAFADAPVLGGLPFCKAMGMRTLRSGDSEALLAIPYSEDLIGDPETGVIHGGAVTALLDTCGGMAVFASPTRPISVATLDLRIDYMRPAAPGRPLFAKARCYRETRLVTFVSAVAFQADAPDAPIAAAVGAFMVDGRRGPKTESEPAASKPAEAKPKPAGRESAA